ncbi:MAG: ribosome assembly factor SBDS [Promethearchaeota archaeon]
MMRDSAGSKRIDLGKYIIVRLKKNKKNVEMIVDPRKAWDALHIINTKRKELKERDKNLDLTINDLKKMPEIDINSIFEGFTVFSDVHKGETYPNQVLEELFGTTDGMEIAYEILLDRNSEFLWTKEQRDEFADQKRKQIINILTKNCINPKTKKPHPPARIEKAIKEAKYNINLNKTAEEQIKDVIHAISAIIPIKMENVELAVKIPASFAAKAYGIVGKYGKIKQSEWQNDGSWVGLLDIPAGLEAEFFDKINGFTHGRAQIKVLKRT